MSRMMAWMEARRSRSSSGVIEFRRGGCWNDAESSMMVLVVLVKYIVSAINAILLLDNFVLLSTSDVSGGRWWAAVGSYYCIVPIDKIEILCFCVRSF